MFRTVVGPVGSSKAPLVILHGLFGSHRNWQMIAQKYAESTGRLVISADLRNHGKSVKFLESMPLGEEMTWDAFAKDIQKLTLEIGRPLNLLGHSLGGHVAMQSLLRLPELSRHVKHLLIVDIAPRPIDFINSPQHRYLQEMKRISELKLDRTSAMEVFRKTEGNESIVQFLFTNYGKLPNGKNGFLIPLDILREGMIKLHQEFHQGIVQEKITVPTLTIKGGKSDYISDKENALFDSRFTDFNLVEMADSGHWPHYDKPTEFLSILKQHLP